MSRSELPMRPSYDAQSLLNAQPVMVAVIDPASYTIQFQNETGLQRLGNLSGRTCYEAIAGCPVPCAFCKMPQAMSTGEVTVNEVCLPNKQHHSCSGLKRRHRMAAPTLLKRLQTSPPRNDWKKPPKRPRRWKR